MATGTCAVLITDKGESRSLCAYLGRLVIAWRDAILGMHFEPFEPIEEQKDLLESKL